MGMTPCMYFESFVEGNLSDFEADTSSVRYTFNAAVSVSHLADHFFAYGQRHGDLQMSRYRKLEALSQTEWVRYTVGKKRRPF